MTNIIDTFYLASDRAPKDKTPCLGTAATTNNGVHPHNRVRTVRQNRGQSASGFGTNWLRVTTTRLLTGPICHHEPC